MKLWQLILITVLVAMVALSGCVFPGAVSSTPTAVPVTAVPTVSPTEDPITIGTQYGTQVRLVNATVELAGARDPELQAENFTLTFENIGDSPATNVGFNFKEKDLRSGIEFFSDVYLIGTIPANSQVSYQFTTPEHREAYSVTADIKVYWGEKVEFNSTYKKPFTLVGLLRP